MELEQAIRVLERKLRRGLWLVSDDKLIDQVCAWWRANPYPFTLASKVYDDWKLRNA